MKRAAVLCAVLVLTGCAIHQRIDPVTRMDTSELCIIDNPDVRSGFLEAYRSALSAKGYQTKVLDKSASVHDCPITSTYTANWRWDMLMYMAFAQITVYANGKKIGDALYDSLGGSGNMGKFISAETKIRELVDQLFPGRAPAG
ncbi:MAG: Sbal_3080 family lipoprotein [Candidatus Tectimicrobiota bacterium]